MGDEAPSGARNPRRNDITVASPVRGEEPTEERYYRCKPRRGAGIGSAAPAVGRETLGRRDDYGDGVPSLSIQGLKLEFANPQLAWIGVDA